MGWAVGFKANCQLVGYGPTGGVPSVEVFLSKSWMIRNGHNYIQGFKVHSVVLQQT